MIRNQKKNNENIWTITKLIKKIFNMKQYTMQNKQNPSLMKDQGKLKENNQV
jgi:hypothetical protein